MEKHRKIVEEKATKLKNEANDLFKEGNFLNSLKLYEKGLKKWQTLLEKNGHDFDTEENRLLSVFHSNIGLCHKNLFTSGDAFHYKDDGASITRVSRLEAALASYSEAIRADPLWEKPHLRKSVVFQIIKDIYMQEDGVLDSLDAVNDRKDANIIVDLSQTCPRRKVNNQLIFNDFHAGLEACKDEDTLFLEVGVYKFEKSVRIDKKITIIGASTGVILRCDNVGGMDTNGLGYSTVEEARANPVACFTILSLKAPIYLKRLRFQMMLFVKSGFRVSLQQCLFDGENHFVLIQVDPISRGTKDKIPKEMRKIINWNGNEKKKTIETAPIILTLEMCIFVRCWRKNCLMANGEAVHISLSNCLFDRSCGIIVRHGAVMGFKDCEIRGELLDNLNTPKYIASGGKMRDKKYELMAMCSNKSRLHLVQTNMLAGTGVSGVLFAYKTQGEISKSYLEYSEDIKTHSTSMHALIEEATVHVKMSLFVNKCELGKTSRKDELLGVCLRRQYSSTSKILKNKFVNCSTGIHLNNGASPNVHGNTFMGNTKNHILLSGGANPNIVENTFDMNEKNIGEGKIGVMYKGGSGGILARNTFIKGATSICIDDTSAPVLIDNIYQDPILSETHDGERTVFTIHVFEGNTFINNSEEEKDIAESLQEVRENITEPLRQCDTCKKFKPCELCGKCKASYYCSPECQRADWDKHEQTCKETENLRKGGKEIFIGGKPREPCRKGCPHWTKNQCQHCTIPQK